MNKFTLRFTDQNLEQSYYEDGISTKYQVCLIMTGMFIIFFILTIIQRSIIGNEFDSLGMTVGMLIYSILSIGAIRTKQIWAEYSLCILCVVIMLIQLDTQFIQSTQIVFQLAYNLAILHCVIMFTIQYRFALVTNSLVTIFRLYITSLDADIPVRSYVFSILAYIALTAGVYWKNHNSRTQYLLKLKDQKWRYLLPQLVESTFYTFVFNEEQFKFELQIGSPNATQELFIQFMRQCKIGNQTLESYCFTQFKLFQFELCSETLNNQVVLQAKYNGHSLLLKYYEYFVIQPNFMIVLENHEVEEVKSHYKSVNKVQLRSFNGFVGQIMAMRKNSRANAESTLRNILWLVAGKIVTQPIKFKTLINRCLSMVPNGKVSINLLQDFTIVTIKPLFVLMMIELLHSMNGQPTQILIIPNQEYIQIILNGQLIKQQLQNNKLFKYAIQVLMVNEQLNKNGFMFTIPLVLDISYLDKSIMNI